MRVLAPWMVVVLQLLSKTARKWVDPVIPGKSTAVPCVESPGKKCVECMTVAVDHGNIMPIFWQYGGPFWSSLILAVYQPEKQLNI